MTQWDASCEAVPASTWDEECESVPDTVWTTTLYAHEHADGFIQFLEYDSGLGFIDNGSYLLFTGTVSSRISIKRTEDGYLLFGT